MSKKYSRSFYAPVRPFNNVSGSKSDDRQTLCSKETSIGIFWGSCISGKGQSCRVRLRFLGSSSYIGDQTSRQILHFFWQIYFPLGLKYWSPFLATDGVLLYVMTQTLNDIKQYSSRASDRYSGRQSGAADSTRIQRHSCPLDGCAQLAKKMSAGTSARDLLGWQDCYCCLFRGLWWGDSSGFCMAGFQGVYWTPFGPISADRSKVLVIVVYSWANFTFMPKLYGKQTK